jgi:uncharacterized protein (TIGR03032 family)
VHDGAIWVLDSGRGYLVRVDPATGAKTDIVFCPGFLRGMSIRNNHAVVCVSALRADSLPLPQLRRELEQRNMQDWCGILIVDLARGVIADHIRYEAGITELFDIALLPDVRNPITIGPATEEILTTVRYAAD